MSGALHDHEGPGDAGAFVIADSQGCHSGSDGGPYVEVAARTGAFSSGYQEPRQTGTATQPGFFWHAS